MIMFRQGDLLFIEVNAMPSEVIQLHSLNVLGSSVTGHTHKLTNENNLVFSHNPTWQDKGNFYLQINEDDKIVHEEHGSIVLKKGIYEVRRQREVNGYVRD